MSEVKQMVKELANQYGRSNESLLPILQGIVTKELHISEEAMIEVARELDMSAAQVYGTATFYSFLDTRPTGKYVIRVCKTITCMMHGKNQIIRELENLLKIRLGETTHDGVFTLLETNCLGQCHKGPAMLINELPFTELTPEKVRKIIIEYRNREISAN
ncbi:NADH-quinone oxidoreductase subunit NuoE [Marinilabiliaceae bacterium JC017]|nr:NADH-quinone oxidoreductase subunit NuoE [Marinilabiliaceae bacterium JC017]